MPPNNASSRARGFSIFSKILKVVSTTLGLASAGANIPMVSTIISSIFGAGAGALNIILSIFGSTTGSLNVIFGYISKKIRHTLQREDIGARIEKANQNIEMLRARFDHSSDPVRPDNLPSQINTISKKLGTISPRHSGFVVYVIFLTLSILLMLGSAGFSAAFVLSSASEYQIASGLLTVLGNLLGSLGSCLTNRQLTNSEEALTEMEKTLVEFLQINREEIQREMGSEVRDIEAALPGGREDLLEEVEISRVSSPIMETDPPTFSSRATTPVLPGRGIFYSPSGSRVSPESLTGVSSLQSLNSSPAASPGPMSLRKVLSVYAIEGDLPNVVPDSAERMQLQVTTPQPSVRDFDTSSASSLTLYTMDELASPERTGTRVARSFFFSPTTPVHPGQPHPLLHVESMGDRTTVFDVPTV